MLELRPTCENCGKALPVRPAKSLKGPFLGKHPASTTVKHKPVDPAAHAQFAAAIRTIPPEKR